MKRLKAMYFSGLAAWLFVVTVSCQSPYYADKGAALGGVAGGLTGAALGDRSGRAAGGALVGSALGAATGAAVGNSMDAEVERREANAERRARVDNAVSISDVASMADSGVEDDVIINQIRTNGVQNNLTPGEIIDLHEKGVSKAVIDAMQQEARRSTASGRPSASPPVIVEESYVVPPYYGPPPWHRYHYRRRFHRRRPGVSWGFSYSH
ncbi:MAG: glycine zipper domain-containing protein [Planctomycetota bacterium]